MLPGRKHSLPIIICCLVWQAACGVAAEIPSPEIDGQKVIELDEAFDTFTAGGSGRFLVFYFRKARKIALLDVSRTYVVATVDAPGDDLILAAGLDKLFVANPSRKIVHRYTLATLERERSFPITSTPPQEMLIGSSAAGPLLLWGREGPVTLYDTASGRPLNVSGEILSGEAKYSFDLSVSADGRTMCGWHSGISSLPFEIMQLNGRKATRRKTPDAFGDAGRWLIPSFDSARFFKNGAKIYGPKLQPLRADQFDGDVLLPSDDPRYFLAIAAMDGGERATKRQGSDKRHNARAWICTSTGLEKLVSIDDIGDVRPGGISSEEGHINRRPRVRYLPTANVIVSIPSGGQTVILTEANLNVALREQGRDYLHVVSLPPPTAWIGRAFEYQMETVTDSGPVQYSVETGPAGLTVSNDGKINWTPRSRPSEGSESIVISVKNRNGRESFHAFEVDIEKSGGGIKAPSAASPPNVVRAPAEGAKSKAGEPDAEPTSKLSAGRKIDDHTLEIPEGDSHLVTPGLDYRTTLLLKGKQLTTLGADGVTPRKTIEFHKEYARVGERADYWIGVSKEPFAIEQIDKRSLRVKKSRKFTALAIEDLALHPKLDVSYVAIKAGVTVPHFKFLVYEEDTGEARESDAFIGNFLAADPSGKFLVAGYRDIYQRGSSLLFNPDRIDVVPEYGNIDFLIRYDLDRAGIPAVAQVKNKAGGNGNGIRLSRDGARVAYLSVVGSPPHSGDLAGWDPRDFQKVPTIYSIKGRGRTDELAFHPFLPLVACLGKDGAVLFDRESGDELPDKLREHDLGEADLKSIWFSEDGASLVFDISMNDASYLRRVQLSLTEKEQQAIDDLKRKRSEIKRASDSAARPPN